MYLHSPSLSRSTLFAANHPPCAQRSDHQHAAIDMERVSRDVAGSRRGEEGHGKPELFRLTMAIDDRWAHRRTSELGSLCWVVCRVTGGIEHAGAERVHRDAVLTQLNGQCLGETMEAGFRRDVVRPM